MGFFNWFLLAAAVAALPLVSNAAVLPRQGPTGFMLSTQAGSGSPAAGTFAQNYNNYALQAAKGKFWVGGPYASTAVISCGKSDGSNTTCALNAQAGPQTLYVAPDSSLSFTAPNAAVPAGLLPGGANLAYWSGRSLNYAIQAGSGPIWNSQYVVCKAPANDGSLQIFTLENFQGCPGGEPSAMLGGLQPSGDITGYGEYRYST